MIKILRFREKYKNNRNPVMMTLIQGGKPNYFECSLLRSFSYRVKVEVGSETVSIFLSYREKEVGYSV
jgi:hypothetical protein